MIWKRFLLAASMELAFTTRANIQTQCVASDICFSLNIPDTTVSSGSGNIYIQISAPIRYGWVSLAQGSKMSGANYMVIYTSGSGKNVTLSPRLANGLTMPTYDNGTELALLAGPGVSNDMMTANIKCSNCESWNGGSMNFAAASTIWIYAYKADSALNTDDLSANIASHGQSGYGTLTFSSVAHGGADFNPFSTSIGDDTNSGGCSLASPTSQTLTSTPAILSRHANKIRSLKLIKRGTVSARNISPRALNSSCAPASASSSGVNDDISLGGFSCAFVINLHAIIACVVFAIVFPAGGVLVRLASFPSFLWIHGILQVVSFIGYVVAASLGIYLLARDHKYGVIDPHPLIGLALLGVVLSQAPLGWLHHVAYIRTGGRTIWSYLHLWVGRIAIPLGIANGILGFLLARESILKAIIFGVVGGMIWLIYMATSVIGEYARATQLRKKSATPLDRTSEEETRKEHGETADIQVANPLFHQLSRFSWSQARNGLEAEQHRGLAFAPRAFKEYDYPNRS